MEEEYKSPEGVARFDNHKAKLRTNLNTPFSKTCQIMGHVAPSGQKPSQMSSFSDC